MDVTAVVQVAPFPIHLSFIPEKESDENGWRIGFLQLQDDWHDMEFFFNEGDKEAGKANVGICQSLDIIFAALRRRRQSKHWEK